jgi:hypothetical protein
MRMNEIDKYILELEESSIYEVENRQPKSDRQATIQCDFCGCVFTTEITGESAQCPKCQGKTLLNYVIRRIKWVYRTIIQ